MDYRISIDHKVYVVTQLVSFHVSDTARGRFMDVAHEEDPDRTMIEFALPDGRTGIVPVPTPIQDVAEYFNFLDEQGDVFKVDSFYIKVDSKPKVNLHTMLGVSPT
jgi:hypothetical protein